MKKNAYSHFISATLLLLLVAATVSSQEFRATITGKVTDPNGALLPGATVVVKNVETNVSTTVTTNDGGSYTVPFLLPGKYNVTATSTGFKTSLRENIVLNVSDNLTVDVQLEIGTQAEVNIATGNELIERGTVSTGSVIDNKQISELPLIDGAAYQLATLAPGISYTGNPAFTSPTSNGNLAAFRSNGATGPNQITLDGSPNFAIDGAVGFTPPSDAVQQFKVQTNVFDAQQGYSGGATVNVAVKSGTNDLHGSLYYFNRAKNRTANNFFSNRTGQPRPERTYHRFGGTLNGPVYIPRIYNGRDRTFFLFAYERLKNSEAEPQLFTVPTTAMRNGDFSAFIRNPNNITDASNIVLYNPFSGTQSGSNVVRTSFGCPTSGAVPAGSSCNIIPTNLLNPVAVAYLKLYPQPNTTGNADGTLNYFSNMIRSSNYRSWLTRIDHKINDKHSIFGKYYHSFNPEDRYNWTNSPVTEGVEYRTNDGASLDYTAILSNTMVFDIRSNLSRFVQERRPQAEFDPAQLGFTSQALAVMRGYTYLPRFDIRTYDAGRPVRSILGSNRSDYNGGLLRPFYVFSLQPSVNQVFGNHAMKYGYDLRVLRENFTTDGYQGGRYFFDGLYTSPASNSSTTIRNQYGRDVAAFLLGIPSASTSQSLIDTSSTNYSVQSVYHGFFFQDDWRLTPKLTLNLGLRYELELGVTERYDRIIRGFDFTTSSSIESAAIAAYTTAYNANPNNFPLSPGAFRVRGGYTFANGDNRSTWDADRRNVQPRFGVSYQLNDKTVLRGGFGVFVSPYRIETPNQTNFSASTAFIASNNNGLTFVGTLNNPFPSGLQSAFGSGLGLLTRVGQDIGASDAGVIPLGRKNAKFSRLIVGVQRELPGQFVIEANYVTSWGHDLAVNRNLNFVPRQYLADLNGVTTTAAASTLDTAANTFLATTITNPFRNLLPNTGSPFNTATTITRAQSLLAYPQFTNVWVQEYNGTNRYNALQLQGSKRFSKDLTLNMTYTFSSLRERVSYLNPSDINLEDRVSTEDRPNRFTLAAIYQLPLGRGKKIGANMNRILDAFIGGWQLNGTYEWQQGQPILLSQPLFYAGDVTQVESRAGQRDGQGNKFGVAPLTVFNTTGFLRLSSSSLRTVPTTLDNLRHMPFTSVNLSISKNFNLREGMKLQFRAEALNAFNHPYFIDVNVDPNNASFGLFTTQRNLPRDIQLAVKFTF